MLTNEEFDKWISALRGGEYKQAQSFLRKADKGYCCLGVLADTLDYCEWLPLETYSDGETKEYYNLSVKNIPSLSNSKFMSYLPRDIISSALATKLMTMNDDGVPFNEIADFIEANRNAYIAAV